MTEYNPYAALEVLAIASLLGALTAPTLLRLYWRLVTWPFRQVREFIYGYRHHEEVFRELETLRRASEEAAMRPIAAWLAGGRAEAGRAASEREKLGSA